jgi:hypothetical protein
MTSLPFAISPEAIEHIVKIVRDDPTTPETGGLVPVLSRAFGYQLRDCDGMPVERYAGDFFSVGWYSREVIEPSDFVSIAIDGLTLFVDPQVVHYLAGNQLIVDRVEVGVPTPSDKVVMLLKASVEPIDISKGSREG